MDTAEMHCIRFHHRACTKARNVRQKDLQRICQRICTYAEGSLHRYTDGHGWGYSWGFKWGRCNKKRKGRTKEKEGERRKENGGGEAMHVRGGWHVRKCETNSVRKATYSEERLP
eukprot:1159635-Pelagomonas_calceolata.AAC.11